MATAATAATAEAQETTKQQRVTERTRYRDAAGNAVTVVLREVKGGRFETFAEWREKGKKVKRGMIEGHANKLSANHAVTEMKATLEKNGWSLTSSQRVSEFTELPKAVTAPAGGKKKK